MSSLFGQVWLWSLLSFVAGVALTWLVLVRPAKRELADLEERLLTAPRPTPSAAPSAPPEVVSAPSPTAERRDEFDNWHVEASRAPVDPVLTSEPQYDVANMKLDKRDELLEELDDEHRPLSDFEEEHDFPELEVERPRSLFERLAPESHDPRTQDVRHVTRETLEHRPQAVDEEPELPPEVTHTMRAIPADVAVAEPALRQDEPTAPPEVVVFQPREVWREEPLREVYDQDEVPDGHEEEDEPERRSNEETALIPATELARAIAEVDRQERPEEPQAWPEHDLTGHFAPVDVESARGELSAQGPQTDVIKAVVDSPPAEAAPEVTGRGPGAHTADPRPAERGSAEPYEPKPYEASFRPVEPRAAEPVPAEPKPYEAKAYEESFRPVEPRVAEPALAEPKPYEPKPYEASFQPIEPRAAESVPAEPKPYEPKPYEASFQPVEPRAAEPVPAEAEPNPYESNPYEQRAEPQAFEPQPAPPAESERAESERAEPAPFEPTFVEQPAEPAPFQPTFVEQPADQQPSETKRPEPKRPEPKPAAAKKDEPARPRSLFEPLVTPEDELESEQSRPTPPPTRGGSDQPFVPTLAPELLASSGGNGAPTTSTGLPQRPTRAAGTPRPQTPAPLSPPPVTQPPTPPRPVRPRPVGFSPSTGGRPAAANGTTRYQGQQEGFNPRSPFGPGSVLPKSDGLAPAPEFQVKATLTGRRYFTAESANFRETRADVWFRTTADAEKAGFRQAP